MLRVTFTMTGWDSILSDQTVSNEPPASQRHNLLSALSRLCGPLKTEPERLALAVLRDRRQPRLERDAMLIAPAGHCRALFGHQRVEIVDVGLPVNHQRLFQ